MQSLPFMRALRQRPGPMDRPHRHHDLELNLVEGGRLEYLFGANHIEIVDGQVAVFWGAIPHRLIRVEDDASLMWITIPLARVFHWGLPRSVTTDLLGGLPLLSDPDDSSHVGRAVSLWLSDIESGSSERMEIALLEMEAYLRRLALGFAHRAESAPPGADPSATSEDAAVRMAQVIADRYAERLCVADLAAAVHLHPGYAATVFRQTFGLSIGEYLTRYRVAAAQRLLAMTDDGVLEIGLACGFGSSTRFHASFREICGQSPRQYRLSVRHADRAAPGAERT